MAFAGKREVIVRKAYCDLCKCEGEIEEFVDVTMIETQSGKLYAPSLEVCRLCANALKGKIQEMKS